MLLLLKDIEFKGILDPVSDVATGSGPETRIADPSEIDWDPSLERKKTPESWSESRSNSQERPTHEKQPGSGTMSKTLVYWVAV